MCHLLLRFLCLHEAAILALLLQFFWPNLSIIFVDFSICTSATASAEPCSPRGEVPWSIAIVNRRVLALSRVMTRTVSVLNVWGFRMHARRFTGSQNSNFVQISISEPSALGLRLRFLIRSHPFFPDVFPRRFSPSRPGGLCGPP